MELIIRKSDKSNFEKTENLTRETFWNLYNPGCVEHFILHQIRTAGCYIEALDMVAIYDDKIIGHIISTKARVIDNQNMEHEVLCVGPISVLPSFQNNGIGTKLLNKSIEIAKEMGFIAMILFGNPDYYHRFGFRNAKDYEITTKEKQNFEAFMALELREKGLDNVKGRFFEDDAFAINEDELNEFEKLFPAKEKGKPKIDISH